MRHLVIGAVHRVGTSRKSGTPKPYDFATLTVLLPATDRQSADSNATAVGMRTDEIQTTLGVVQALKQSGASFPCYCDLTIETGFGNFGGMQAHCTKAVPERAQVRQAATA